MASQEKTSISVKADTRKRIKYLAETKGMDYDALINWVLDELRFPKWEDVQNAVANSPALVTGGN